MEQLPPDPQYNELSDQVRRVAESIAAIGWPQLKQAPLHQITHSEYAHRDERFEQVAREDGKLMRAQPFLKRPL